MKITSIKINDFRKFKEVEISPLSEKFNLIIGKNKSGKTSLLSLIAYSLGIDFLSIRHGEVKELYVQDDRMETWLEPGEKKLNKILSYIKSDRSIVGTDLYSTDPSSFDFSLVSEVIQKYFDSWMLEMNKDFGLGLKSPQGEYIHLSDLSRSQDNLLAILIDITLKIAQANPELGKDAIKETPGIVLIDDLDLSLDIDAQREVVEKLMWVFPNLQFFATTHSAVIVQSLYTGKLIKISETTPSQSEIELVPTDAYRSKSIEDILEDVMDIPIPQRSRRYHQMLEASEQYYALIRENADSAKAKELLDELSERFGDHPAYWGFLRVQRKVQKKEKQQNENKSKK